MIRVYRQEDVVQLVAEAAEVSVADVLAVVSGLSSAPIPLQALDDFQVTDPQQRRVLDALREVVPRLKGEHE